jgi:hypothetical protein
MNDYVVMLTTWKKEQFQDFKMKLTWCCLRRSSSSSSVQSARMVRGRRRDSVAFSHRRSACRSHSRSENTHSSHIILFKWGTAFECVCTFERQCQQHLYHCKSKWTVNILTEYLAFPGFQKASLVCHSKETYTFADGMSDAKWHSGHHFRFQWIPVPLDSTRRLSQ